MSASANPPLTPQSVLVFLKGMAAPVVLYTDNPVTLYDELKRILQQTDLAQPKVIEKPGAGPLKKVCFLDTELCGVALQGELR